MVWSRDWALFPCMWISYANTICWRECPFPTYWIWFGGPDSKETACNAEDLGPIPGSGRSLEKGLTTHSSILAWRIPWTEEPGGLQSMGSQRVGHDMSEFHWVFLAPFLKIIYTDVQVYFLILLHWSTCLFLHQYHTVLFTVALW